MVPPRSPIQFLCHQVSMSRKSIDSASFVQSQEPFFELTPYEIEFLDASFASACSLWEREREQKYCRFRLICSVQVFRGLGEAIKQWQTMLVLRPPSQRLSHQGRVGGH